PGQRRKRHDGGHCVFGERGFVRGVCGTKPGIELASGSRVPEPAGEMDLVRWSDRSVWHAGGAPAESTVRAGARGERATGVGGTPRRANSGGKPGAKGRA